MRVPASEVEGLVVNQIRSLLASQNAVGSTLAPLELDARELHGVLKREITERTTKSKGRLTALMRLSYLAPDIIADILAGRQPPELSVKRLLRTSQDLPLDWPGQRAFLGLARRKHAPLFANSFLSARPD